MSNIAQSINDLVGATPLLRLRKLEAHHNLNCRILAKLEYLNPAGSVKDRVALAMIDDAERRGLLKPGATIVEPTSGNTGIGLAAIAASRGYRIILTMPDTMSEERRRLLAAYGAELVLTDGRRGMTGAIERAAAIAAEIDGSYTPSQFDNPANPAAHRDTTGVEIWRDTDGVVDMLVAGVGTGGTITGVGGYLKSQNELVKIVAVEPHESPVLSRALPSIATSNPAVDADTNANSHTSAARTNPHTDTAARTSHGIQGIGAGFVPGNLDITLVDQIERVTTADAVAAARAVATIEGLLVGVSSGAAIVATLRVAAAAGRRTIVVILPDGGERYLSTQP